MLSLSPNPVKKPPLRIKIIAVGNAGINILDRWILQSGGGVECVALNTDSQSLASSVAREKVLVGEKTTRGLGVGGDPDLALAAWEEDAPVLEALFEQCEACILLGCLGGGTAGVFLPKLAYRASAAGLPVFVLTTTPFSFEGNRRSRLAEQAAQELRGTAALMAVFPNDALTDLSDAGGPVGDAFAACDVLMAGVGSSMLRILRGKGPMEITSSDLGAALGGSVEESLFAFASAKGANRANEVVPRLLKSPLLSAGCPLERVSSLVVQISSGPDLSLLEIQTVLSKLQRELEDHTSLHIGICTDLRPEEELAVSIFGVRRANKASSMSNPAAFVPTPAAVENRIPESSPPPSAAVPTPGNTAGLPVPPETVHDVPAVDPGMDEQPVFLPTDAGASRDKVPVPAVGQDSGMEIPPARHAAGVPASVPPEPAGSLFPEMELPTVEKVSAKEQKKSVPKTKQEVLPLDVAARGRFDRSEPTIFEGEDLDIPTFVRLKLRLK